jgi:VCBS repeat-containing protein
VQIKKFLVSKSVLAALLVGFFPISPSFAATPSVSWGGSTTITEQDSATSINSSAISISGDSFDSGFIDFSVGSQSASDILSLETVSTPTTTNNAVSIVGTSVYLGNGTSADNIGTIDETKNGTGGQALRINFVNSFPNSSFELDASGTTNVSGWTEYQQRIRLGTDAIEGVTTVDTGIYPNLCGGSGDDDDGIYASNSFSTLTTTASVSNSYASQGSKSLKLELSAQGNTGGWYLRGPAVASSTFQASAGDNISFDWRSIASGDRYSAFGYLLNTTTNQQTEILDEVGSSGGLTTNWATKTVNIAAAGSYKFIFVSGAYNGDCGQQGSSALYIDNVVVVGSKVTSSVARDVARLVRYRNTSDSPSTTRTVTLLASDGNGLTSSATTSISILTVNDAPSIDGDGSTTAIAKTVSETDASTTASPISNSTGTVSGYDPDQDSPTYSYGISGESAVSGSVSKAGTYGTLSLNTTTGAYTYVPNMTAIKPLNTGDTPVDSFNLTVSDGSLSGSGTLNFTISGATDTEPAAPVITSVIGGNGFLTVLYTQSTPANPITNYQYSTDGTNFRALSPSVTAGAIQISTLSTDGTTALSNGTSYSITLKAVNTGGTSEISNSLSGIPSSTPTVTAPVQPTFALSTNSQEPGDFKISGFSGSATLNVSIGFVDPPSGVTFALPSTTGLTAGFGYDFTGGKTQLSFTGSMSAANAALQAMTVSTGSNAGTITIRVTASEDKANVYYNPINGHYYKYVSRSTTYANSATAADSAIHLAESTELFGLKGYLATITTAQEQQFIYSNISGNDIWIGGTDDVELLNERASQSFADQTAAEGKWYWISGPDAGTKFWEGASSSGLWIKDSDGSTQSRIAGNAASSRYENWCSGNASPFTLTASRSMSEPNNASGEHYILEKWNGATCWNDYGRKDSSAKSAYLVEFSENWGTGAAGSWNQARGSYTSTLADPIASASISALADNSPRSVSATAGLESAVVTWSAPLSGTVTSYTVTSTPGSLTCTTSTTTCTITGLTGGTSYTFVVTATFNDSTTKNSLASLAVTPTGSSSGTGNSGGGNSSPSITPSTTPTPTPTPTRAITAAPSTILSGPVKTNTKPNQVPSEPVVLIGGVPTTVKTNVINQTKLNVLSGQLNLELEVKPVHGGVTKTNSGSLQVDVKKGGTANIAGTGVKPLSTVQVFLPLQGTNAKEIARIPTTSTGSFSGDALFATQIKEAPLPIGKQVLQIVSQDSFGKQAVVEMTVNISQPVPSPELSRLNNQLPEIAPGTSTATQAGLPVPVTVIAQEQDRQATVQGDGWTVSIKIPSNNGAVNKSSSGALIKLVQNKSAFVQGSGFMPGTRADVWLFSDPTLIGTVEIDENGNFSGQVAVNGKLVPVGEHTLQIQGVGEDGYVRAANLGVLVDVDPNPSPSYSTLILAITVGLLITAFFIIFSKRRKKEEAKHAI